MCAFFSSVLFFIAWLAMIAVELIRLLAFLVTIAAAGQTLFRFGNSVWERLTIGAEKASETAGDALGSLVATLVLVAICGILSAAVFGLAKTEGGNYAITPHEDYDIDWSD